MTYAYWYCIYTEYAFVSAVEVEFSLWRTTLATVCAVKCRTPGQHPIAGSRLGVLH